MRSPRRIYRRESKKPKNEQPSYNHSIFGTSSTYRSSQPLREPGPPAFEVIVSEFPRDHSIDSQTAPVTKFTIDPRKTEEDGPLPETETHFIAETVEGRELSLPDFSFQSPMADGECSSMQFGTIVGLPERDTLNRTIVAPGSQQAGR